MIKDKLEEYLNDAQEIQEKLEEYIADTTTVDVTEESAASETLFQYSMEKSNSEYLCEESHANGDDSRSNIINKTNCYGQLFRFTFSRMPVTYFGRHLLSRFQKYNM